MKRLIVILIPPVLSVGLLGAIVRENRAHVTPKGTEEYHQRAKEAVASVPYRIGSLIGKDDPLPQEAVKLLRQPNYVSRTFVDTGSQGYAHDRRASLLIIQTRESRDMVGHYPPNCYVSSGMTMVSEKRRTWQVGELAIPGTEYEFVVRQQDRVLQTVVYNFLIVPGKIGIVPDMQGVRQAAEDYQQRYFGAAQFQVVFHGTLGAGLPQEQRDEIFQQLVRANTPVVKTLLAGGIE